MGEIDCLPGQIKEVYHSLEPFIKQAQEVAQIRRVLALHLSSRVNAPISHPLSLLEAECEGSNGVRGLRREYIRCLLSSVRSREEYEKVSKEYQLHISPERQDGTRKGQDSSSNSLELFLEVVKYRRKHERLRILQDYVDMLAQKPAAASDHLDLQIVLKDVDSLPSVPSDVMTSIGTRQESQRTDLNNIVNQLEKSVLRAKLLLKREQKLLSKVKAEGTSHNTPFTSAGRRLQALGTARNELINWIETELAKAGESPADSDSQGFKPTEKKGKDYIDSQLSSIQRQYARYTRARQALTATATGSPGATVTTAIEDDTAVLTSKEEVENTNAMSHVLHPYVEELTSVSNQQKSVIQQKSHLTISLAKQLKEAGQALDRLAEESHLLPSYPLAGSQRKALEMSFGDEISNHEKPDSSRRARAWVHASELASKAAKDAVAEKLEEGEEAILDAHQTLLDLQCLLGDDVDAETEGKNMPKDIWARLDGHLGVIKRDGVDEV